MIEQLVTIVNDILGAIGSHADKLVPIVKSFRIRGVSGDIPMQGPSAGLVVGSFHQFPDIIRLTFSGKIGVGSLVQNLPAMTSVRVRVLFGRRDNPLLSGEVAASVLANADGTFEIPVELLFNAAGQRPFNLSGVCEIIDTTAKTEAVRFAIENANLAWFTDQVERWEEGTTASKHQEFLARVRKTLLPSGDFNLAIGRQAKTTPLYSSGADWAQRLKTAYHLQFEGEAISISHVLIGIEGGRRQDPQPSGPMGLLRIDTLVTWAGDLGGALVRHLMDRYYFENPNWKSLQFYVDETASRADLVGDVDGVNLSFSYDNTRSLADNLRAYYGTTSRKRYSRFIEVTETDDGQHAIFLDAGNRLTQASRDFIADQILKAVVAPLIRRVMLNPALPHTKRTGPTPPAVEAAIQPQSPEILQLTQVFADFLEQGLAAER